MRLHETDDAEEQSEIQSSSQEVLPSLGLLSKTLAPSPVFRWIIPARIRHKSKDDLIFIGEDILHIKEIQQDGHLRHVATKDDFDCQILSANVLGTFDNYDDTDSSSCSEDEQEHVKNEGDDDASFPANVVLPPQVLLLALDTQQILFLFACEDSSGHINFELSSSIPLPAFANPLQQLGKHLAVDPKSRAVAVAAAQDNVMIYSAKPMERLGQGGGAHWGDGFLPISSERPVVKIRGVIQQMQFLYPPDNDSDHVILLLVVIKDKKTSVIQVDWSYSLDIRQAETHNPHPISRGGPIPSLLIPIQSSGAFVLVGGKDIDFYTDILSGQAKGPIRIELPDAPSKTPGASPHFPRWVAWARPRRGTPGSSPVRSQDYLYLAREDGEIFYISLDQQHLIRGGYATHVDSFGCHIDTAFACYGKARQDDYFAIGADMSDGGIFKIRPISHNSPFNLGSDLTAVLPNWTPMTDLIETSACRGSMGTRQPKDILIAPGGRQPYGKLSELRYGKEARISTYIPLEVSRGITRLWALPFCARDDLLLLVASPLDTQVLTLSLADDGMTRRPEVTLLDTGSDHGIDLEHPTIAAAVIEPDMLLQVTTVRITMSQHTIHERSPLIHKDFPQGSRVVAADIDDINAIAVLVLRMPDCLVLNLIRASLDDDGRATLDQIGADVSSHADILSVRIFATANAAFAVCGTSTGSLLFYHLHPRTGMSLVSEHSVVPDGHDTPACESIVVLHDYTQSDTLSMMLLCGLRNGQAYVLELRSTPSESLSVNTGRLIDLGHTAVTLIPDASHDPQHDESVAGRSAFASCGDVLYKITWHGQGTAELTIAEVWLTDVRNPSYQQKAITAMGVIATTDSLLDDDLGQSLVAISGDHILIAMVEDDTKVVPRSMQVPGTPTRAILSQRLGYFVSVTQETSVNPQSQSRSIRPMVHFEPVDSAFQRYTYPMEPGARVYCLMEWIYKDDAGKKYLFLILGTGPMDQGATVKGGIAMLQPLVRDGAILEVMQPTRPKKFDAPVYALAAYGELGYVACSGTWIYLFQFRPSETKFFEIARRTLMSPTVSITTSPPLIYAATANDSFVTLHVKQRSQSGSGQENGAQGEQAVIEAIGSDSRQQQAIHHLTVDLPHQSTTKSINIMSTRNRQLIGFLSPDPSNPKHLTALTTLFTATLPRSQVRLRHANIRPRHKPATAPGILSDALIGTAVDGTITAFALLEPGLTHRLRWIQRLCERSWRVCPQSPLHTGNAVNVLREKQDTALLLPPLGFSDPERDAATASGGDAASALRNTPNTSPEDMHVNGDILSRLLSRGGAALLSQLLREEAEGGRKDRLADWVRENLDAQLARVEPVVEELRRALDRWW